MGHRHCAGWEKKPGRQSGKHKQPDTQRRAEREWGGERAEWATSSGLAEAGRRPSTPCGGPGCPCSVPQPWASARTLRLLHGRPGHRAASGPTLPGWCRVPGRPLPRSAQCPPWPRRRWQGQERTLPRRAHWPSHPQRHPAQPPQPAPARQALGAPLRILLPFLWEGWLEGRPGALELHGGWGTGDESWDPPAPGRLEQGAVWPLGPVVGRHRGPWPARRPQAGRGGRELGGSPPTRRGATWCAQPLHGMPAAAAAAPAPPARCPPWARPPP